MIATLTGRVESVFDGGCVLEVNGVGYLLACSRRTLERLTAREGAQKLLVETRVSQDAITLYGFADAAERDAFRALIEVKTVGPQKALLVLSALDPAALAQAIAGKERRRLAAVKGLGAATANRIIDEPAMQKWALGRSAPEAEQPVSAAPAPAAGGGVAADAVSALVNLGLRRPEAEAAIARALGRLGEAAALERLIREGLRELAR
ncbi:MAG: Holliday junction branch migration protein RuvA [Rhodovarius sp.]|nr:Holliday junction branch migration protein RuvA [Rhodovarius sp.]MDW8315517.1 Holliday junction branch migration protein RuvA [Rhodovarius sp.]